MKKTLLFSMILLVLGATSCSKDQKAVKKLDGTWNATSYTITDGSTSYNYIEQGISIKMTFDDCKLKDDEWCNLTQVYTAQGDTDTETALYKIQGDGTQMVWKDDSGSSSSATLTITELTKSDMTLTQTEDGTTATLVFEKE